MIEEDLDLNSLDVDEAVELAIAHARQFPDSVTAQVMLKIFIQDEILDAETNAWTKGYDLGYHEGTLDGYDSGLDSARNMIG